MLHRFIGVLTRVVASLAIVLVAILAGFSIGGYALVKLNQSQAQPVSAPAPAVPTVSAEQLGGTSSPVPAPEATEPAALTGGGEVLGEPGSVGEQPPEPAEPAVDLLHPPSRVQTFRWTKD
jgi:hypothetical protein